MIVRGAKQLRIVWHKRVVEGSQRVIVITEHTIEITEDNGEKKTLSFSEGVRQEEETPSWWRETPEKET